MKIAVVGNSCNDSFADLVRAAGAQHRLTFVEWSQISAAVGSVESVGAGDRSFDACLIRGMPHGTLEQVIFRMNLVARWEKLGLPVFNSPRSLEIAIDKYLTLVTLREAGLPVPDSRVCQSVDAGLQAFQELGGDVVVKPVFGGEGRGIIRVSDPAIAIRVFKAIVQVGGILFLQQFIESGNRDLRLLVVGREVFGMSRHNPDDWRANASRGAICRAATLNEELQEIGLQAAVAVGNTISGVDVVQDADGSPFVLEVNGVPGWNHLANCCNVDIARKILDFVEHSVETNARQSPVLR